MRTKRLLAVAICGIVIGIGLLILAKYMLTNYAYSVYQSYRSHLVRDTGLGIFILGLICAALYVLEIVTRKHQTNKTKS